MKAPFPYFGGKSTIASNVWAALGQPKHYIEPFFGSGAVLLARPNYQPGIHVETVNDADALLCNVWRSLQFAPDEVARWCDWPVNHADLMARKAALIRNEGRLLEGLADDKWCDPIMAGYWIWAASCWIGSGLMCPGQRPHVGDGGMGVTEPYNTNIYKWFRELSERLRYVRVVCGDWTRVCGGKWQDNMGDVGIFMDPPYSGGIGRDENIYHKESTVVAAEVRAWCLERGDKKTYRIVLAGYGEEHQELLEHGWTMHQWKTMGGYGNTSQNGKQDNPGKVNRNREALFVSPHCQKTGLF